MLSRCWTHSLLQSQFWTKRTFLSHRKVTLPLFITHPFFPTDNQRQHLDVHSSNALLVLHVCVCSCVYKPKWYHTIQIIFQFGFYLRICLGHSFVSGHENVLHYFNVCREVYCPIIYLASLPLRYMYEFPTPLQFCYNLPDYNYHWIYTFVPICQYFFRLGFLEAKLWG